MLRWGDAPDGAGLLFVLEEERIAKSGKPYRLAKMVTTAATREQFAYFKDERFALFGNLGNDVKVQIIPPGPVSEDTGEGPPGPVQGELF